VTNGDELSILAPDDALAFHQLLAIYREAIEPSEQRPADEVAQLAADTRYVTIVSRDMLGLSGFAMLFCPPAQSFWLLEYMAVRPDRRSQGLGQRLFVAAKAAAAKRCPGAPGVLEVDQPNAAVAPGNDAVRRLQLYRSLGCRRIEGLDYILPLRSTAPPPAMYLLVDGLEGQSSIAKAAVREWLTVIYTQVYRQPSNDTRIATMLEPLKEACALSVP
jgi:GNAT superfamily N-acetyltransferase